MQACPFAPSGNWALWSRHRREYPLHGNAPRNRTMSLAYKIIQRLMTTPLLGTGVAYGWLYIKAAHVQNYLEQRALVQQAREISDFISIGESGSVVLNLPPRLSEAYNSVKSSYRYAVRDEAGRIVAASGRGVGPLPLLIGSQGPGNPRRTYEQDSGDSRIIGAAIETTFDQ